jgi:hypothetical protein
MARRPATRPKDSGSLAEQIEAAKARVAPLLPDVDESDLDLILSSLLRPFGTGRCFFLREVRPGVHVF